MDLWAGTLGVGSAVNKSEFAHHKKLGREPAFVKICDGPQTQTPAPSRIPICFSEGSHRRPGRWQMFGSQPLGFRTYSMIGSHAGRVTYSVSMVIEEGSGITPVINLTFNICQTEIAADELHRCLTPRSGRSISNTHVGRARLV